MDAWVRFQLCNNRFNLYKLSSMQLGVRYLNTNIGKRISFLLILIIWLCSLLRGLFRLLPCRRPHSRLPRHLLLHLYLLPPPLLLCTLINQAPRTIAPFQVKMFPSLVKILIIIRLMKSRDRSHLIFLL